MKANPLFHVRAPNGVTVDLMESRGPALALAHAENYEVYALDRYTGRAVKIRSAQHFKAREYETSRPVSPLAARRPAQGREIGFSFSQPEGAAVAL